MNEKIPVNRLAQEIAASVGSSPSEVQQFIKDLFAYVEAEVSAGNDVSVLGLGRFSKSAVNGEPIAYEPDAEYAATLNADFEMFSPVELNDGVTEEAMEMAVTEEAVKEAEPDTELHRQSVAENEPEPEAELQHNTAPEAIFTAPDATSEDDAEVEPDAEDSEDIVNEPEDTDDSEESEDEANHAAATDKSEKVSDVKEELAVDIVTDAHVETIAEEEVIAEQPETPATEPLMAAIPEQEEEYVIVHGRKSRFWMGFIIGLVLGFAIGVIAFVAYLVNISVITPEKLFN
jgi:DNA translocase ftsK